MLAWIQSKLVKWAAAAGVVLALLTVIYGKGRSDQKAARARDRLQAVEKARKVEHEVDGLGAGSVGERLNEWMRDKR